MNECRDLKVPIKDVKDSQAFLNALQAVIKQKAKAANLLYEEIEQDVAEKEKFVMQQK